MDQNFLNELMKSWTRFRPETIWQSAAVLLMMVAALIVLRICFKKFKKASHISDDLRKYHVFLTGYRIIKVFIVIIAILGILSINGINVTGFSMGIGILATVAAFAVKDSLQDMFAGLTIMLDKFFSVGDAVEFNGRDGIVVSFTIRTTKIEFLDDRSVLSVMNRNISKIRKLTHLVDIDLPLPYELDRKKAFSVLTDICEQARQIEGVEDCQLKGTQEFTDYAVNYKIRFFCEPDDRPDIRREVMKTIQDGLAGAGIRIPYRQLDIHTVS